MGAHTHYESFAFALFFDILAPQSKTFQESSMSSNVSRRTFLRAAAATVAIFPAD